MTDSSHSSSSPPPTFTTWDELNVSTDLLRGIYGYGYEHPSPIQSQAIMSLLEKRNILAQAQSGTGKTATFVIGALAQLDLGKNETQVLVISPTKELTIQTAKVFTDIGGMMDGLRVQTTYGGKPMSEFQTHARAHVVCGCPGRINDLINRKMIRSESIQMIVLDEADEMLSQGFRDQIYDIIHTFPDTTQIALFSATLPEDAMYFIDKILIHPVRICVKREMQTLEGIKQYYICVDNDMQKSDTIKDLFKELTVSQCIIYCNSVQRVCQLTHEMVADGFQVSCIHSNMNRDERENAFKQFKMGSTRMLISTNLTARGIDVQQVSVVINFDLPHDISNYLHRIGRSGRWGRKGVSINLITPRDRAKLNDIQAYYSTQIVEMPSDLKRVMAI